LARIHNSPGPRIRCFAAMALDHPETDALFRHVEVTLKPIGIDVFRVDRIEHNDDIDDRIISEIEKADFVLADLTYARPSVYFEAGYAQRGGPVIYTARGDHFQAKVGDPNGNLRIHFDLQMKNIIAWNNPGDAAFLKHLRSRALKVIAPLIAQKRAEKEEDRKAEEFQCLSLVERLESLREVARSHFQRLKYRISEFTSENDRPAFLYFGAAKHCLGAIIATKREGDVFRFVFFHPVSSITKSLCQAYKYSLFYRELYTDEAFKIPQWTPRQLKDDFMICSVGGSSGAARIAKEIPYLRRGDLDRTLVPSRRIKTKIGSVELDREVTVHVIDSTACLVNLERELNTRFPLQR
jgi:nucleoside 2-deoxyribosyltransferase